MSRKIKSATSLTRGEPPACLLSLNAFMIFKLGQYVQEKFDGVFSELPVRARHFVVLRLLLKQGATTQQALCESLWIDRASMVGVVKALVDLKYVSRGAHPTDRRSVVLSITAKGKTFIERHWPEFDSLEQDLFPSLNKDERGVLRGLLQKAMQSPREI